MPAEFDIIKKYFTHQARSSDIALGVGDDAALINLPHDRQLVHALDTLVAGVHFPVETSPTDIGWKALAVNLSDMAAMGAEPAWFSLGLTLPEADEDWISDFARGMFAVAEQFQVELVGGDTTRGPLCISIAMSGYVPTGRALLRSGAQVGDQIFVTGALGEAAAALASEQTQNQAYKLCLHRLNRPMPRVAEGRVLRDLATACIDISDGLLADLGHLVVASGVAANIFLDSLPGTSALRSLISDSELRQRLLLSGGDDYELCFTVSADKLSLLRNLERERSMTFIHIGEIVEGDGVSCLDAHGETMTFSQSGYEHF